MILTIVVSKCDEDRDIWDILGEEFLNDLMGVL